MLQQDLGVAGGTTRLTTSAVSERSRFAPPDPVSRGSTLIDDVLESTTFNVPRNASPERLPEASTGSPCRSLATARYTLAWTVTAPAPCTYQAPAVPLRTNRCRVHRR